MLPNTQQREQYSRDVSNWLAAVIYVLQEQYRRPNYAELLAKLDKIDEQIPNVKRALIYLNNTKPEGP